MRFSGIKLFWCFYWKFKKRSSEKILKGKYIIKGPVFKAYKWLWCPIYKVLSCLLAARSTVQKLQNSSCIYTLLGHLRYSWLHFIILFIFWTFITTTKRRDYHNNWRGSPLLPYLNVIHDMKLWHHDDDIYVTPPCEKRLRLLYGENARHVCLT